MSCCLSLGGDDGYPFADEVVHQRGFADIGVSNYVYESGTVSFFDLCFGEEVVDLYLVLEFFHNFYRFLWTSRCVTRRPRYLNNSQPAQRDGYI